jgi:phosphatidylglycerophosphate synthase
MKTELKIVQWNSFHAVLFSFLFILYTVFPTIYPVIFAGLFSFLVYWLLNFETLKTYKPFAGYANLTTLLRLMLVIVAGLLYNNLTDINLFIIGLSIFALDGLDGFIARKLNQESEFGAYFDMETDAFYVCIFTIILFEKGLAGYWIIVPGFMRYLNGTIILFLGKKSEEEIRSKIGPLIAGLFFMAILTPFVLSKKYYHPVLIVSSALLVLSFLYSFIRIFRVKSVL